MPLEIVKEVAESERLQCDIEFFDIYQDRLFTTGDGGKIKVTYRKVESKNKSDPKRWLHRYGKQTT